MATNDPLVSIEVQDQGVMRVLNQVIQKTQDPTDFFRLIGEYKVLAIDEQFEKEEDPFGNPWQKNSPRTIALKRARGQINKVLQARGIGRASIRYQVYRDRVVIGTNVGYMRDHQLGIGVPQRVILATAPDDLREIQRIGSQYLLDLDNQP